MSGFPHHLPRITLNTVISALGRWHWQKALHVMRQMEVEPSATLNWNLQFLRIARWWFWISSERFSTSKDSRKGYCSSFLGIFTCKKNITVLGYLQVWRIPCTSTKIHKNVSDTSPYGAVLAEHHEDMQSFPCASDIHVHVSCLPVSFMRYNYYWFCHVANPEKNNIL